MSTDNNNAKEHKRERIPEDTKAKVVAEIISGTKPYAIKEMYGISLPTITRIKQAISPEVLEKMDQQRREALGDLVLTHLETSLESAINVMHMTEDKEWMRSQNAKDLNVLYGTMTDKAIRMAESIDFAEKEVTRADNERASMFPEEISE